MLEIFREMVLSQGWKNLFWAPREGQMDMVERLITWVMEVDKSSYVDLMNSSRAKIKTFGNIVMRIC